MCCQSTRVGELFRVRSRVVLQLGTIPTTVDVCYDNNNFLTACIRGRVNLFYNFLFLISRIRKQPRDQQNVTIRVTGEFHVSSLHTLRYVPCMTTTQFVSPGERDHWPP